MSLNQREVDELRVVVLTGELVKHVRERNPNPTVKHLRFPKPSLQAYVVREGNPPADIIDKNLRQTKINGYIPEGKRFAWEKGLRLELDLGYIEPETALCVLNLIHEREMSATKGPNWNIPEIRQHTLAMLHEGKKPVIKSSHPGRIKTPEDHTIDDLIAEHDLQKRLLEKSKLM